MWPWQVCQKRERQRRDNFKIDPNNYIKSIPLPDGWFAYQTATGKVIYYNVVSKKSQWSPPPNSGYSKKNLLTGDAASDWYDKYYDECEAAGDKESNRWKQQQKQQQKQANLMSARVRAKLFDELMAVVWQYGSPMMIYEMMSGLKL